MNRRHALRILAGTAALPVLSEDLLALGRALRAPRSTAGFQVLDAHQQETVATIAELIIPATDTAGARAARVHEFVDLLLAEWARPDERTRFLEGLADVDRRSRSRGARDYVSLAAADQTAVLTELDAEVTALREANADAGTHFFSQMKWLTVYGYYTSEIGVTQELKDPIIPGRYDPCVATGIGSRGGA